MNRVLPKLVFERVLTIARAHDRGTRDLAPVRPTVLLLASNTDTDGHGTPHRARGGRRKPDTGLLDKALRAAGYEPHTATSGPEALRLIDRHGRPFDAFVIDVLMPQMSGTELAQQIRRANPSAKILYFTGFVDR